jgi:hypothetical protein
MLPVRYELNLYILFRRNSVFKGLRFLVHVLSGGVRVLQMTKHGASLSDQKQKEHFYMLGQKVLMGSFICTEWHSVF